MIMDHETKMMMMKIAFEADNKKAGKGKIVFVGDSLTAYCDHYTFYEGMPTVNRGIGGDLLRDLPDRMACSVYDLEPSAIVFLMGLNDLNFNSVTVEDMGKMYDAIFADWAERYPTIPILVQSLYPLRFESDDPRHFPIKNRVMEKIPEVNGVLQVLCARYGLRYLDMFTLLSEEGQLKEEYSLDGAHVNNTAYAVISDTIKKALREEFSQNIDRRKQ